MLNKKFELVLVDFPKKGDIACEKGNFESGFFFFKKLTQEDAFFASKNDQQYYVLNAVKSHYIERVTPEIANHLDKPTKPYIYGDPGTTRKQWSIPEVLRGLKELNYIQLKEEF